MKSAPSALLASIAKNVTSFATLITLTRGDGKKIRFTQHDRPIPFNGESFRNDIPYNLSAIDTNSDLSVDTTTLELAIDGVVFTHRDVGNDVYRGGQIEIALVDWTDLGAGKMILREGWFTQLQDKRPNSLSLEIGGLMKVLDMSIGRTYQPLCDADLGDSRCRVALDPSQAYSPYNLYTQGDWAYIYDTDLLTPVTGTNLNFEAGTTPTGWDLSEGSAWRATLSVAPPNQIEGTHYLTGDANSAAEQFVAQTFDLIADGVSAVDIDAGQIAFIVFALVAQIGDLTTTFPRFVLESIDNNGDIVAVKDTRYLTLDAANTWREKALHINLRPGTRKVRLYLYAKTKTGTVAQVGFDRVRAYTYDVLATHPDHSLIFKCVRTPAVNQPVYTYGINNPGFETETKAVSTVEDLTGWTKGGNPWGVINTRLDPSIPIPEGANHLVVGDNASGIQTTYTITQAVQFVSTWANLTRLAQGKYVGRLSGFAEFGDANASAAGAQLEFFDADNISLGVIDAFELTTNPTLGTISFDCTFSFPVKTARAIITLRAQSPTGSSTAKIGFDSIRFVAYDAERPDQTIDLVAGTGDPLTEFNYTAGTYNQDGNLVWRAFPTWRLIDTVSEVTDNKNFKGTDITGDDGAYETAKIEWLSGQNAGRIGLIRTWFDATKAIRTYFPQLNPITVGDRFYYYPSCQKRFNEDCVFKFNNGLNFQGFPYLPGALEADDKTAPVNPTTPEETQLPKPAFLASKTAPVTTLSGTVTYPAGMEPGDLMVAVAWNTGATVPSGPPKWVKAGSYSQTGCSVAVFYKLVEAQDIIDGSAVFTNTTLNACLSGRTIVPIKEITISNLIAETGVGVTPGSNIWPQPVAAGGAPGILIAVNGAASGAIHNDTANTLTPPGQIGVLIQNYLNMMSPLVTQRAIDTSAVTCGYYWASTGSAAGRGMRRGAADSGAIRTIMFGVTLGIIGVTDVA